VAAVHDRQREEVHHRQIDRDHTQEKDQVHNKYCGDLSAIYFERH
jgi:hypothetical protein